MVTMIPKTSFMIIFVAAPEELSKIKDKVSELIDYTKEFNNANECEEFIRSVRYEHIFLVVTPDKINDILAQNIHHIRHVQSILLFDSLVTMQEEEVLTLRQVSYKMQDSLSNSDDLYQRLWKCVQDSALELGTVLSTLSSCPSDAMTTNVVNNIADFSELWYPLFINFLLDLPIIDTFAERCRFIEQCRKHYARNPGVLKSVDEFEANYTPAKALYYYSRDGFVYRLINRALRGQAIDGIISFRFLLHDIRDQLRSEYRTFMAVEPEEDFSMIFYRGQRMSVDELNQLQKKHRAGTLITTNSYFSTSMKRDLVRAFYGQPSEGIVSVLFEISVQIKISGRDQSKPFAYIGDHSQFGHSELEVLFSIGSFFSITKIVYDASDSLWVVQLTFVDDDDSSLEVTKDFRTLKMCSPEIMMIKIGNLLANHPRQGIRTAEAFYKIIMTLNFSETLTAACFTGFGWLALTEKDTTLAIEHQKTALNHYEQLIKCEPNSLVRLRMMCYNCIGNAFRLKKTYDQALSYFLKAQNLDFKIPIDKYAMYDGYRNITAVNIASIYKLLGHVDCAWDTYKKILAHDMNSCIHFHGHTYLTIAQAGLHEAQQTKDADEYDRCSSSWKAFLDTSLTSMSSNFRRSIISGVLLLGFEYTNNRQTCMMAIDYFKKVIIHSQRYVKVNREDRLIVLQCQNHVSRLYTKKQNYESAINHALNALQMCNEDDLTDIAECYESMAQTYRQLLLDQKNDLTPEDICRIILFDNPFTSVCNSTLTFERSEFTFGQFSAKINPIVLEGTDRKRQLAYCYLKIAALAQMQTYKEEEQAEINDDDFLRKQAREHAVKARELLYKTIELQKDNPSVQKICSNNLAYLDGNFDSIINCYTQDLEIAQQQQNTRCIGEDAFCYIAHLYARKTNVNGRTSLV